MKFGEIFFSRPPDTHMSRTKAHIRDRNKTADGGSRATAGPKTVNGGDAQVKRKRESTNRYKPGVFPTKSKRIKPKTKFQIRGFYAVSIDPDTTLPRGPYAVCIHLCCER